MVKWFVGRRMVLDWHQPVVMGRCGCGMRRVEDSAAAHMALGIEQLQKVSFVDDLDVVTGRGQFNRFLHL